MIEGNQANTTSLDGNQANDGLQSDENGLNNSDMNDDSTFTYDYEQYEAKHNAASEASAQKSTYVDDFRSSAKTMNNFRTKIVDLSDKTGGTHIYILLTALVVFVASISELGKGKKPTEGYALGILGCIVSTALISFHLQTKRTGFLSDYAFGFITGHTIIWTLLTIFLTSSYYFHTTGNGYFALWIGLILTLRLFSAETALLTGVVERVKVVGWKLGLLGVSSIVLFVSCVTRSKEKFASYGIFLSIFSFCVGAAVFLLLDRLNSQLRIGVFGSLFAVWVIGAFLLTFPGPFSETSNGYFASWGGVVASGLLIAQALNLGSDQTLQTSANNPNAV